MGKKKWVIMLVVGVLCLGLVWVGNQYIGKEESEALIGYGWWEWRVPVWVRIVQRLEGVLFIVGYVLSFFSFFELVIPRESRQLLDR